MTAIRTIIDPDTLPVPGQRWDVVQLGSLAALLAFMPAAFGAVEAWSELIVLVFAALLSILLALRVIFDRGFTLASTWLFVPLGLFVALVALQLLPLPTALVAFLSPATVALKQELLSAADDTTGRATLTFYPHATAHFLRFTLVACAVFVTVASICRRPRQIKLLLTIIFAIGCAQALLAIAQLATGTSKIYWLIPTERGIVTSGSFINYSHFCQFMNLSLSAGVALLLVQLFEQRRQNFRTIRGSVLARLNWDRHGWLICGIVLCALSIFTSMSRNGVLSLVIAAAVVGVALGRRGALQWRGWLLGLLPLGVLCGLLIFGFNEVYYRLSTLQDATAYEGRWELTAATLRAWRQFPLWGTGLGTHEVVFPMFDTAVMRALAQNADNDYAQLLEETGLFGATLIAALWIGVAVIAARLMLRSHSSLSAAAFGIAFGLLAVTIHSATDFGQRIPANFCLTATMCGLLVAIARIDSQKAHDTATRPWMSWTTSLFARRCAAIVVLFAVVSIWGWSLTAAYSAFLGERWWAAALAMDSSIRKSQASARDEDFVDLIASAENAYQNDPTNASYGHWLGYYRWLAISRTLDPDTGQVVLHPDVIPFVAQIADDLAHVRQICPTYGPPYSLEGQLRTIALNDPRGADLIRQGVRLAPYDPPSCLVAGQLAAADGKLDEAQRLLERAVNLEPGYFRDVAQIYLFDLKRPDLARALAADNFARLRDLAAVTTAYPQFTDLTKQLEIDVEASLRRRATTGEAAADELAALARIDLEKKDPASAVDLYRRALGRDYKQIEWRLELARALAAAGQSEDALHEVRICLRLRPEFAAAKQLLEQLSSPKKAGETKSPD